MAALDPALGLLSALTSLPAALYYARVLGAAAVHPVRDADGRIVGLRANAGWTRTLVVFLCGTVLAAAVAIPLHVVFGSAASLHAALGAVLVAGLWPHGEKTVRVLLLLLLIGAGASRLLLGAEPLPTILAGYAIGVSCVWIVRRYRALRPHG